MQKNAEETLAQCKERGKQPTKYAQYRYWMMQSVEGIQCAIDEEKGVPFDDRKWFLKA